MRRVLLTICLVLPGSALAAADIVAACKYPDGSMIILVTRDKAHVRMDTLQPQRQTLHRGTTHG